MLKIGIVAHFEADTTVVKAKNVLNNLSQQTDYQCFNTEKAVIEALETGAVAVAILPLDAVPTTLPTGLVIAALTERALPRTLLGYTPAAADADRILGVKEGVQVGTLSALAAQQFLDIRPDGLPLVFHTPQDLWGAYEKGAVEAILIPETHFLAAALTASGGLSWPIHPRELMPQPGAGTAAFLTAVEDKPTRRLLRDVHPSPVSWATNIERTLLKHTADIAAYCEVDSLNNYHLWAAALVDNQLVSTRCSQSTSFQLADICLQELGIPVATPDV